MTNILTALQNKVKQMKTELQKKKKKKRGGKGKIKLKQNP
jgi:hypothetical protein